MSSEHSRSLSNVELTRIVLRQQSELKELAETVAQLKAQMARIKAQLDCLGSVGHLPGLNLHVASEREQAVRDALRHLSDVTYLAQSPLARMIARLRGRPLSGQALQNVLLDAIQQMKPAGKHTLQSREDRCYHLLRLRYLECKKVTEVAETLAISERQYYRDLKVAIHKVADQILGPCCL